jgi:hypothetical protein
MRKAGEVRPGGKFKQTESMQKEKGAGYSC